MELITHVRRLQVLESIATCGSFSGAADALQMTQSAVSQHVATLERAMDLPLIERGTRPVQLTDAAGCTSCAICARVCPDVVFTVFARPKGASR